MLKPVKEKGRKQRGRREGWQEIACGQLRPIGSMMCWVELQEEREGADQIGYI